MGRLIDAGLLKESMKKFAQEQLLSEYQCLILVTDVLDDIDNQPTAYDVDKVVERLEEARDELLHSTDYNNDIINYCLDWFDMAIDIVKGAVKDE